MIERNRWKPKRRRCYPQEDFPPSELGALLSAAADVFWRERWT